MQSYRDVEHIIIDGNSTDDSVQVISLAAKNDDRLHYITERDSGQGEAVNKGFAKAQGEIIAWINSDDFYYDSDVFQFVIDFFTNNPEIDLLYGGMAYVDENNKLQHIRIPPKFNKKLLKMISYIGNTNAFFRRSVIEKYKLDEQCHFVIDHEFMLSVTNEFAAQKTDKILACFRVHDNAKTQKLSNDFKDKERRYRDVKHKIVRSTSLKMLQLIYRVGYKLQLYYSDFNYLKKIRKNPPYNSFIK